MEPLAFLTIVNVPPDKWLGEITEDRKTIGRSVEAQIRVPSNFRDVSRVHAEIYRLNDDFVISDLSSRTGTKVNGVTLKPRVPFHLFSGDRIRLASLELRFSQKSPHLNSIGTDVNSNDLEDNFDSVSGFVILTQEQVSLSSLTRAEQEVALCMGRGEFSDETIARQLFRSPHTVRTQVGSILRKLGLHSRVEIVGLLKRNQDV